MTEKYKKIFGRVIIGAAAFWALAFIADILVPWIWHMARYPDVPKAFSDYGTILSTIAAGICIAAVLTALIVCVVKSKKEKANGEHNEHPE